LFCFLFVFLSVFFVCFVCVFICFLSVFLFVLFVFLFVFLFVSFLLLCFCACLLLNCLVFLFLFFYSYPLHGGLHSLLAIQSCLKVCQDVGDGGADLLLEELHVLPGLLALLVANPGHDDYACEDKIIGSNTVLKMVHI